MKLSALLATLVGGQLLLAFFTQALIMATLGAGVQTDCFIAAQTVPTVLLAILATALLNVWQTEMAVVSVEDRASIFASALGFGLILGAALVCFVLLTSEFTVPMMFPGFDAARIRLTTELMCIVSIGTAFNACSVSAVAAGRITGRFVLVETIPLVSTLGVLAVMPLTLRSYGLFGAAWLLVGRAFLIFALTSWVVGMKFPSFRFDQHKRRAVFQIRPVLVGSIVYKLGPVVDRYWGSRTPAGNLTIYNFAGMGATAAGSVIERAMATPFIPSIARTWHGAQPDNVIPILHHAFVRVWGITALCAVALIPMFFVWTWLCAHLLRLDADQADKLYYLVLAFIPQLGTTGTGTLLASIFYASGTTGRSVRIMTATFLIGLFAKSVAFSFYGLIGMALTNSLQLIATNIVLYISAVRLVRSINC